MTGIKVRMSLILLLYVQDHVYTEHWKRTSNNISIMGYRH